jgi:hypothetical protein
MKHYAKDAKRALRTLRETNLLGLTAPSSKVAFIAHIVKALVSNPWTKEAVGAVSLMINSETGTTTTVTRILLPLPDSIKVFSRRKFTFGGRVRKWCC